MATVYLNGDFLPEDQACVSVLDRGFIFGDGVYEVIPAYNGKLFRLSQHLERLQNSLDAIRLCNPMDDKKWAEVLAHLVVVNGGGDVSVYLQVTRGVAKRDHALPNDAVPTLFAMSNPIQPVADSVRKEGVHAVTLPDIRWQYCHIKSIALLPNVLLRQQAIDQDAVEAILIRDGEATEGAASNLFIVVNGSVITPPKGPLLLPGITRDLVLELAVEYGISHEERVIAESELAKADEVWLTSSTKEILPVSQLNRQPIGNGKPGPVWHKMIEIYQNYKRSF